MSVQLDLAHLDIKANASLDDFALPQYAPILSGSQELIFGSLGELYIFGDEGSGKSHLISAIHQQYLATHATQGRLSVYLSATELLTADPQMLAGLEQFSLILLDDIHLFAGHKDWQEGLFHLINRMRSRQHKLVFTADTAVRELDFSLLDLITRLSQALALSMPYADSFDDKLAIIELLLKKRHWRLSDDIVQLLAETAPYHIGDILMLLERIVPQLPKHKPYKKFSKKTLNHIKEAITYQSVMIEIADLDTHYYDDNPSDNVNNLMLPL